MNTSTVARLSLLPIPSTRRLPPPPSSTFLPPPLLTPFYTTQPRSLLPSLASLSNLPFAPLPSQRSSCLERGLLHDSAGGEAMSLIASFTRAPSLRLRLPFLLLLLLFFFLLLLLLPQCPQALLHHAGRDQHRVVIPT